MQSGLGYALTLVGAVLAAALALFPWLLGWDLPPILRIGVLFAVMLWSLSAFVLTVRRVAGGAFSRIIGGMLSVATFLALLGVMVLLGAEVVVTLLSV